MKNSLRLFEIFDLLSTITQRISRVFFLQGKSDTGLQISPEVSISQFRTYVPTDVFPTHRKDYIFNVGIRNA